MKWENPRLFANAVLPGKPKRATRPSHMFVYLLHNSAQGCFRNIQEWKVSCLFSLTFVTAVLPSDSKVLKNKPGASALVLAEAQRKSLTTERSGSYNHHEVWPHGLQMRQHCFWFREKSRYCHETSAARRQGSRELQPNSAGLFLWMSITVIFHETNFRCRTLARPSCYKKALRHVAWVTDLHLLTEILK